MWAELLFIRPAHYYSVKAPPSQNHYLAAILVVLLLAAVFFTVIILSKSHYALASLADLTFCAVFILSLCIFVLLYSKTLLKMAKPLLTGTRQKTTLATLVFTLVLAAIVFKQRPFPISILCTNAILVLSPLSFITIGIAIWRIKHKGWEEMFNEKLPATLGMAQDRRVVILILDEMDERLAFLERPLGVSLPELDRISNQSINSFNAFPPCRCTEISIPALLTGKMLSETKPVSPNELMLYPTGEEHGVTWSSQNDIFSHANEKKINAGIVGWYHPFSRIIGNNVTVCHWYEEPTLANSVGSRVSGIMWNFCRSVFETPSFSLFGQSLRVLKRVEDYQSGLQNAKELAADSRFGLVLLHLPMPHGPFIYDSAKRDFTVSNSGASGYLGNLVCADNALGTIRTAMELTGVWDKTAFIVTSDHWWRNSYKYDGKVDHRVPFILKLPDQNIPVMYDEAFNTVLTHDLVLALFQGELETPTDAVTWLASHGKYFPPTKI